jgi:hypothetical protein
MRISISSTPAQQIQYGKNSSWTTDLDVSTLTPEQRRELLRCSHSSGEVYIYDILDASGEITAASIQAAIDASASAQQKRANADEAENRKKIDEYTAIIDKYEHGAETCGWLPSRFNPGASRKHAEEMAAYDALVKRRDAESERRVFVWEKTIAPEVAEYLAGGPRTFTKWNGTWGGKKETFEKIQAEDKRRTEAEKLATEQRKKTQLSEAVTRLGTPLQQERWESGVMPHSEALDLIRAEWVAPLVEAGLVPQKNEFHLDADLESNGSPIEMDESDKKTLTDAQWVVSKKAMATIPGAFASYHHQYYYDRDDLGGCDVIRLSKKIGEYDFSVDIIL